MKSVPPSVSIFQNSVAGNKQSNRICLREFVGTSPSVYHCYLIRSVNAHPSTQFSTKVAPCLWVTNWPRRNRFSMHFCRVVFFSILLWKYANMWRRSLKRMIFLRRKETSMASHRIMFHSFICFFTELNNISIIQQRELLWWGGWSETCDYQQVAAEDNICVLHISVHKKKHTSV